METVVPAEYLLALVDLAAYRSFVAPDWTLESLRQHFAAEMARVAMLAWGTGAPGNWRVEVARERVGGAGFRECSGRIPATTERLHLTSYDELTVAAQFRDVRLPRPGTEEWVVAVEPGWYGCRVVQLYDPGLADTEAVFYQETPHFRLELLPAAGGGRRPRAAGVAWFPQEAGRQ